MSATRPVQGLVLPPGAGRVVTTAAQQVTFKVTGAHSRVASTFEVVVPPGFDVGAHTHARGEELFYLLEGELDVMAFEPLVRSRDDWRGWVSARGERPVRATPGTLIFVPPGCPHAFANRTGAPVRMLFQSAPPSDHERYFDELLELMDSPTRTNAPQAVAELRARYDIQQLTPLRHAPTGRERRPRPSPVIHHVHHWPVEHLDALDFDPLLHRLVREEPVARVRMRYGEEDAWLVTSYEYVKQVTADPRFSRALTVGRPVTSMTPHTVAPAGGIGRTDPPDHTRLRRLVSGAFNRRRAARLRTDAETYAARLVDAMIDRGPPAELTEALTGPMPERLLGTLLGLPAVDYPQLQGWRRVLLSRDHAPGESDAVKAEIARYVRDLAELRTRAPGEDLFSELVTARAAGALSGTELVSLTAMVVLNMLDQVLNQATTMVYALLVHPAELTRLQATPALLPRAVEELLRFIPQRNGVGMPRIAVADVPVGDALVKAGDAVLVSYVAANRDPRVFTDPDRLDLTRDEAPHLAFGSGAHYCLGAALARMQCEVILSVLLRRLPALRLACRPEEVRWRHDTVNRGPEGLPVTW